MFREATTVGFFALQSARDRYGVRRARPLLQGARSHSQWLLLRHSYRKGCLHNELPMHRDLVCHFMTVMSVVMSPICPHVADHFWSLLGRSGSVVDAQWPSVRRRF
jgi:leucyl-tRNA synthetase